jgi:hypothetical protein
MHSDQRILLKKVCFFVILSIHDDIKKQNNDKKSDSRNKHILCCYVFPAAADSATIGVQSTVDEMLS